MIKNLKRKMTKMARKEQILVSELSDDAPERKKTIKNILKRSKDLVEKITTVKTELTDKETAATDEIATLKTTLGELTTKLTKV